MSLRCIPFPRHSTSLFVIRWKYLEYPLKPVNSSLRPSERPFSRKRKKSSFSFSEVEIVSIKQMRPGAGRGRGDAAKLRASRSERQPHVLLEWEHSRQVSTAMQALRALPTVSVFSPSSSFAISPHQRAGRFFFEYSATTFCTDIAKETEVYLPNFSYRLFRKSGPQVDFLKKLFLLLAIQINDVRSSG